MLDVGGLGLRFMSELRLGFILELELEFILGLGFILMILTVIGKWFAMMD